LQKSQKITKKRQNRNKSVTFANDN
jgi:hypothetical protein